MKRLVPTLAARAGADASVVEAVLAALDDLMQERQRTAGPTGPLERAIDELVSLGGNAARPALPDAGEARQTPLSWPVPGARNEPSPGEIDDLIGRATNHPLGLAFLLEGNLGAVAVTFHTHAFTVEAARSRLR